MTVRLQPNQVSASFTTSKEVWERFKAKVGKGNAGRILNDMISIYLEGYNGSSILEMKGIKDCEIYESIQRLEFQIELNLRDKITALSTELSIKLESVQKEHAAQQASVHNEMSKLIDLFADLRTRVEVGLTSIENIKREANKQKWMIEQYADVLMEIDNLKDDVTTLQEETAAYMKGF